MNAILFVCTGNTCRSPMAEAIAQHWLDRGLLGDGRRYLVVSAGVAAAVGMPPAAEAITALARHDIVHDGRSKALTVEMVRHARVVLCMTASHQAAARALVADDPAHQARIQPLDPAGDVADPLGMGQEAYDALVQRFMELIPGRLEKVLR